MKDLRNFTKPMFNDPQKQKDQMTLLIETALSFSDELTIDNWTNFLKIIKNLKTITLFRRVLDALHSCYNSLGEKEDIRNLDDMS